MRRKISLAALFAAFGLALALGFPACDNSTTPAFATCVVSYNSERGNPPAQKVVFVGTTLSEADLPALTAEGYSFGGWFDGETQAVAGKYVVKNTVTLTAKWTATPAPTPATTIDLSTVTADTVIKDNTIVTGTLGANVKISIADGATVTLKDVTINGTDSDSYKWAGLTCAGGATINLEGTNIVKGFWKYYPGVFVPKGKTLTIKGSGSLAADSNGSGAGIGGCYAVAGSSDIPKEEGSCGTIVIEGGTITATGGMSAGIGCGYGSDCDGVTIKGGTVTATGGNMAAGIGSGGGNSVCGPISISGGTVTAKGGDYAAGVGTGYLTDSKCGAITVANTVTKFTATKGNNATDSVGHGKNGGACGAVTIGGTVHADGISESPYTYQPSPAPGPTPGTTIDLSTVTADTTVANGFTITGTLANNVKISIADGATVTLKNASINADGTWTSDNYAGLNCVGDATIMLEAGTTNTVKGFNKTYPGIHVPSGKTLTINGTGALTVSPNTSGAGMSATGAGIGGGVGLACGNIVIAGGTITASTASSAAAIGSGGNSAGTQTCGNITITGGTVTATCTAQYGAGIGAGINGECGDISITGGTVTATSSQFAAGGAGIGCGGTQSTVGTITIADTVTKVTAVKGLNAQSIGKGYDSGTCTCGTITIGGTVYAGGISASPYTYNPKLPTGGIDGLFSVSATKKVYFSKGNLRATYNGSWTWSFADHQYDAVGNAAANTSISGNGTVSANGSVDLFGWVGASSTFTDWAAFGISNSTTNTDYGTVNSEALKNDWGTNAISNGGNVANYGWRTLTRDEWNYVVNTRTGADSKKGAATVNSVKGWILLPDAWTLPAGASFTAGCENGYTTNSYTAEQWAVMESAGAVFLPVTGLREGSSMSHLDEGYYWSTTCGADGAYNAGLSSSVAAINHWSHLYGVAVRLAKDSN